MFDEITNKRRPNYHFARGKWVWKKPDAPSAEPEADDESKYWYELKCRWCGKVTRTTFKPEDFDCWAGFYRQVLRREAQGPRWGTCPHCRRWTLADLCTGSIDDNFKETLEEKEADDE